MPKSPHHTINLKLSIEEFAALAADADKCETAPTTMALSHVLAGMQQFRGVAPDLTVPASRATYALKDAAEAPSVRPATQKPHRPQNLPARSCSRQWLKPGRGLAGSCGPAGGWMPFVTASRGRERTADGRT